MDKLSGDLLLGLKFVQLNRHYLNIIHRFSLWQVGRIQTKDMRETGGRWSLIWSIGRIPLMAISALVDTNDGKTRPGQSQRQRSSLTIRVWGKGTVISVNEFSINELQKINVWFCTGFTWKCLVLPGVSDTGTFLSCRMALMLELLPTLG